MTKASSKKSGGSVAVACAFDKMVKIGDVKPNPKNPNQHPEAQIDALAKLIKHLGWRAPVTVSNRSGLVVRGHGRLMAAEQLIMLREKWGAKIVQLDMGETKHDARRLKKLDLNPVIKIPIRGV